MAPSTVLVGGAHPDQGIFAIFTPVNSHRTVGYIGSYDIGWKTPEEPALAARFMSLDPESLDRMGFSRETCDGPNRASRQNNWYQDREGMRNGRFSGLPPFIPEDIVVSESMGTIYDCTNENLIPADQMVVRIRGILMGMAHDVQAARKPIGLRSPIDLSKIYVTEKEFMISQSWQEALVPPEFLKREQAET
jgi:hypothetical protein